MSSKIIFVIAALAFISASSATIVQKCSSGMSPVNVDIKGCDKEPCNVVDGTNAIMDIKFKAPANSKTLIPKVRATTAGVTITYPLPEDLRDGCKSLLNGGSCPLTKDKEYTYRLTMPISGFPHVAVTLEFSLLGDNNQLMQCFKVDIKVVKG